MLEICGNIILEIKDLEDLTPVKLANHKNPVKDTCGSKDECKDTKCSDKKESVFGQTFSKYQKSTTFHLIGTRNVFFSQWKWVSARRYNSGRLLRSSESERGNRFEEVFQNCTNVQHNEYWLKTL